MSDPTTPPDPVPAAVPVSPDPAPAPTPPPPAAVAPPANCRMCVKNKATPGSMFCPTCQARRDAAKAAAQQKAEAPPPPPPPAPVARTGVARVVPAPAAPRPVQGRVLPPVAGKQCIQCPRVMADHPDPDDTPVRCGSCVRKNRDQLRKFTRGEG